MRFNNERPIFAQIAEMLTNDIRAGRLKADERIPSARELAASFEVNPNTAARALQALADSGLARSERGMGYFVADSGAEKALAERRKKFYEEELPRLFRSMEELGIATDEIVKRYAKYRKSSS